MSAIRAQYHLRKGKAGLDAWSVRRLIALSNKLPVLMIDPKNVAEIHENHWYFHDIRLIPSPHSIMAHFKLISEVDLAHPVILDENGRLMDGMHRVCKALLNDISAIPAVQFLANPEPDYVDCNPNELPYDD